MADEGASQYRILVFWEVPTQTLKEMFLLVLCSMARYVVMRIVFDGCTHSFFCHFIGRY